jgi:hypothetical protein
LAYSGSSSQNKSQHPPPLVRSRRLSKRHFQTRPVMNQAALEHTATPPSPASGDFGRQNARRRGGGGRARAGSKGGLARSYLQKHRRSPQGNSQALGPREQLGEMNNNIPPTNAKAHQVSIPAQGVERDVLVLAPAKAAPCILQSAVTWKRQGAHMQMGGIGRGVASSSEAPDVDNTNEERRSTRTRGRWAAAAIANRKWEGERRGLRMLSLDTA